MKDLDFFTRDDLFANGFNEDGGEIIKSNIYIVCQDTDGRRFALNDSDLDNISLSLSLEEINTIQEHRIKKIEEHIAKGGRLNLDNWREIDPEYGSEAYQALDKTGYFAEMERQREEEANYMR